MCKKSSYVLTEEDEVSLNTLDENNKNGIVTKQEVDLLKGAFESLFRDEKSTFFKQQEFIQQKENQSFQQHLKKMFVQENNFFKEPFAIQKTESYLKNEKILELERDYAFKMDKEWIRGLRKSESVTQTTLLPCQE